MRNSSCSLQVPAWAERPANCRPALSWKRSASPASSPRSLCMPPAESSILASCSCMEAIVGRIISSWRLCVASRLPPSPSVAAVNTPTSVSAPPSRSVSVACSSRMAVIAATLLVIIACCLSDWALSFSSISLRSASTLPVWRLSVSATSTSSLSSRAITSYTSLRFAFVVNVCSTAALSAFFANSEFRASRCPMNMDSAMVSRYCRSSATFSRTVLYSFQFTFFPIRPWRSDTSSLFENIARHLRLESWKASSRRWSNSWKARPMARRRSVSEIIAFSPCSICDTTSCCWRAVLWSLLIPISRVHSFFLLKLCSAIGSSPSGASGGRPGEAEDGTIA
mmetsp:Transcript_112734/g.319335  ORF Transcript_112734/g.319335 Transcript_112734/m.319335 type:complete len:338 (-) Transcript_112734:72-1085(-)